MKAIWRVLAPALFVLALIAAACGSDDLTEAADEATTTAVPSATTEGADDATTTTAEEMEEEPDRGIDVMQKLARAMRDDDAALLAEVNGSEMWFLEWQIGLRAEPEFTDCTENGSGVSCNVAFGDDFFYTQVTGESQESRIEGKIFDGQFYGEEFPPSDGLAMVEADLRVWVQENHPELEVELYGSPSVLSEIKMTRESGELRMELLDEYLEWRDLQPVALGDPDTWTWVRLEAAEVGLPEDGHEFEVTSMTHGEELFVIVGYRQRSGDADGFVESPVIWTSADAGSWSAVDLTAGEAGEGLYDVAYGSDGFVAVGEVGGDAIGAPPIGAGIVWTSLDGSEWARHAPDEWASFVPRAVASTTDGAYVATGAADRFHASIWHSTDGVSWNEVAVFEDSEAIGLEDVVAGPSGMVAVGWRQGGEISQAFVVQSSDGLSWKDVYLDNTEFPESTRTLNAEVDGSGGFVAAGNYLEAETRAALWTSPDGMDWDRWPVESTDDFVYIGDMITLPETSVTIVSGAQADADQPWIESGALWRIATGDGSASLVPLAMPEDISFGTWVTEVAATDSKFVAFGYDGESSRADVVIWTASQQ